MNKTRLAGSVVAALFALFALHAEEAEPKDGDVVPLIIIDDVPLYDAIRNLTRQINLNWIPDPCLPATRPGGGGTNVSLRVENNTVEYALDLLLKKQGLTLITNPVTTVARVVPIGHRIKPVSASQVATDTNRPLPILTLDGVTLVQAIETLARTAKLNPVFDAAFSKSEYARDETELEIRWTKITIRQALAALLDNYDLVMVENSLNASVRITPKPPAESESHVRPQPKKKR